MAKKNHRLICAVCGKVFYSEKHHAKYCSKKCQDVNNRVRSRINDKIKYESEKQKKADAKKRKQALVNVAVEARNAGMSYGQYVAKMGL